jgi:hypothetical protein
MRTFDVVAEEDIADDQEINITAMGRDNDERTIAISMILNLSNF